MTQRALLPRRHRYENKNPIWRQAPDFPEHFTTPITEFEEDCFTDGLGCDGSSIRSWQAINESDMLVMPDPSTAVMDPFTEVPTLSLICDIVDPITREDSS